MTFTLSSTIKDRMYSSWVMLTYLNEPPLVISKSNFYNPREKNGNKLPGIGAMEKNKR